MFTMRFLCPLHRSCIFLPRVIKLTHHSHYLSHVFHILDDAAKCGICQGRFSSGYGGYACIDKTCDYVAHSTCATNINVWDGIDHIEGELEERSSSKDVVVYSIEEMDAEKVHHCSHDHGLSKIPVDGECWQLCEACILPIDMGTYLGCRECSFALHEECARLPPEMDHPLHRHRLTLKVQMSLHFEGFFTCSVCKQDSCGFMYRCCQEDCWFEIDVKCASFTNPFNHTAHTCPLYLRLESRDGNTKSYMCCGCHEYSTTVAACTKCEDSSFDFKCLNLPPVVRFKYDIHPLYLYFDTEHYKKQLLEKSQESWGRERLPYSWCDVCEEEIHENLWFYICFDCRISLHVKCILGNYPYMKPGHNIKVNGLKYQIASNSGASRPIFHTCHRLCRDKLVFKEKDLCFCSFKCIPSFYGKVTKYNWLF